MPLYRFHIENGPSEDHAMALPNDAAAIDEGLRTAAGLLNDLTLTEAGSEHHQIEVSAEDHRPILKIDIRTERR